MRLLLTVLITAIIIYSPCLAGGYKITNVIEVGPAAWVPFSGPLRWSPDGSQIAFFAKSHLLVSDTLGNTREVKKIEMYPHRHHWVSDTQIAIMLKKNLPADSVYYRLVLVDVESGNETVLEECYRGTTSKSQAGWAFFDGPFLTLSGDAYYDVTTYTGDRTTRKGSSRVWIAPDKAPDMSESYTVRWGSDGLYKVSLDGSDSVFIVKNAISHIYHFTAVSPDLLWVLNGGYLLNSLGSDPILMYDIPFEKPPGSGGCDFLYPSFNPNYTEILFNLVCDDGHTETGEMVGTFNYSTMELTILDDLIGLESCTTPVYSPDGRRIALLSGKRLYIIEREVL